MIITNVPVTWYELPADGQVAEAKFLEMLRSPGETWIKAYNFSLPSLYDEIRAASKSGVVGHCLLDHIQSAGPSEHGVLEQLASDCQNWEFIITTAGGDSKSSGQIEHDKAMVVAPSVPGHEHQVFTGSVNFSTSGWTQGNIASYFESSAWGQAFITEFNRHRTWTLANEAKWQLPTTKLT